MNATQSIETLASDYAKAPSSSIIESVSAQNSTISPLLRLPVELREQIWHHVFRDLWITILEDLDADKLRSTAHTFREIPLDAPLPTSHRYFTQELKHPFALPLTCSQTYSETHLLLYTLSVFEFPRVGALGTFLCRLNNLEEPEDEDELPSPSTKLIRGVIRNIMPPMKWLDWVFEGSEPKFTDQFPGLKKIYLDGRKMSNAEFEMTLCVCGLEVSDGVDAVVLELEELAV